MLAVGIAGIVIIGFTVAEYEVEVILGLLIVGFFGGIFVGTGSVFLVLYTIFWVLEQTGMDDNPIEFFLTHTLVEWE